MILHLFHTNDLHSHFENLTRQASFFKEKRREAGEGGEPSLFIDLGDHMDRVNPLTEGTQGKGNVKLLNAMGYDMVTIGNNEGITFTKKNLDKAYKDREFPIVLANLFDENGQLPDWCQPTLIKNVEGFRIGFIGVTAPFTLFYEGLGWTVKPPLEILKDVLPGLRNQVDFLVVLSHVGAPFDHQLASECEGIDLILGSHTHDLFPEGVLVNQTLIAQAGKFGRYVGEITLKINAENQVERKSATVHDVQALPEDLSLLSKIEICEREGLQDLNEPLATIDLELTIDLDVPSPFARTLAEALKEWCETDVGMINSGVLLGDLPKGEVTKGELHRLCPHPLNPCRVTVVGKDLLDLIKIGENEAFKNWALLGFGFRGKRLGGLVFSGLSYRWNALKEQPEDVRVNGEPLDPEKSYTVATSDMFTFGNVAPPIRKANVPKIFMPEFLRDVLAWKLSKGTEIN